MTTYATLTWESTPALWRAYTDPEGEQGFGKTKEEALDELIEQICEGMRESAKDAKLAELTRSLADSTSKLAVVNKALDDIRLACCYGLEEDIDAQEAMLREIIKYARDAMEAAK
jgi:nucleoid-associated protein YejK